MRGLQQPLFAPQTEWVPPSEFKDLSNYDEIAIDLETCDPNIKTRGSGSVVGDGKVVGVAVAQRVHEAVEVGHPELQRGLDNRDATYFSVYQDI